MLILISGTGLRKVECWVTLMVLSNTLTQVAVPCGHNWQLWKGKYEFKWSTSLLLLILFICSLANQMPLHFEWTFSGLQSSVILSNKQKTESVFDCCKNAQTTFHSTKTLTAGLNHSALFFRLIKRLKSAQSIRKWAKKEFIFRKGKKIISAGIKKNYTNSFSLSLNVREKFFSH